MGGPAAEVLKQAMLDGRLRNGGPVGTTCARCDHLHGGPPGEACVEAERRLGRSPLRRRPDLQLDSVAGTPAEAAVPADPFANMTPGAVAATAMHEAFQDLIAGGFTEDQALTFLARAYAAANGMAGP